MLLQARSDYALAQVVHIGRILMNGKLYILLRVFIGLQASKINRIKTHK